MPTHRTLIISLVERGWQMARERSLELREQGVDVRHLIKGRVPPEVLSLVTPHPTIRLMSVPRPWFWPWVFVQVMWARGRRVLQEIWVDNDRTQQRLSRWVRGTTGSLVKL